MAPRDSSAITAWCCRTTLTSRSSRRIRSPGRPISHVIWDGLPPDSLSVSHQQAMLDWLHWGGQLVLIGGAGPTFSIFRDSFLGNYLPADPTGENALLGEAELKPLAEAYPPSVLPTHSARAGSDEPASRSGTRPRPWEDLTNSGCPSSRPRAPRFCDRFAAPSWGLDDSARCRKPPPAGGRRRGWAAGGSPCLRSTRPTRRSRRGRALIR